MTSRSYGGDQGFCDGSTKVLVIKSVEMGEGVKNWMTSFLLNPKSFKRSRQITNLFCREFIVTMYLSIWESESISTKKPILPILPILLVCCIKSVDIIKQLSIHIIHKLLHSTTCRGGLCYLWFWLFTWNSGGTSSPTDKVKPGLPFAALLFTFKLLWNQSSHMNCKGNLYIE